MPSRTGTAIPGGRFLHDVRATYGSLTQGVNATAFQRNSYYQQGVYSAIYITKMLDDPETRRIVVDSEQAARFVSTDGMPRMERYRLPFDQMYIEFTTPIEISEQEPSTCRRHIYSIRNRRRLTLTYVSRRATLRTTNDAATEKERPMTATTTLPQTAEAYSGLVERFAQYKQEVGRMRPVRMTVTIDTKGGLHAIPGDEMLGYYEGSIFPGHGHYIVFSPRTRFHFTTTYGVEFMDGDNR